VGLVLGFQHLEKVGLEMRAHRAGAVFFERLPERSMKIRDEMQKKRKKAVDIKTRPIHEPKLSDNRKERRASKVMLKYLDAIVLDLKSFGVKTAHCLWNRIRV